jgi:hypothetical protein
MNAPSGQQPPTDSARLPIRRPILVLVFFGCAALTGAMFVGSFGLPAASALERFRNENSFWILVAIWSVLIGSLLVHVFYSRLAAWFPRAATYIDREINITVFALAVGVFLASWSELTIQNTRWLCAAARNDVEQARLFLSQFKSDAERREPSYRAQVSMLAERLEKASECGDRDSISQNILNLICQFGADAQSFRDATIDYRRIYDLYSRLQRFGDSNIDHVMPVLNLLMLLPATAGPPPTNASSAAQSSTSQARPQAIDPRGWSASDARYRFCTALQAAGSEGAGASGAVPGTPVQGQPPSASPRS